ncbi:PREDICTED: UPF0481 protein At3g47200-like [Nelumbo nucifera]|uniref:UPF0481 protein At3g47200-like n=2 Tax=Nelumbo nucifera TaxID=4432 RepID=A0A1U7Z0Y4_NELNU|nr:PREDICTED: UPF0481 protein At3g47200-like [Nelumbo nucifera]DAD21461.1 TPA_asm: hypothetical protein HUJ06_022924 [Nelumbo nucifera]
MVAVFNKELLSWYLITLKLRETVDTGNQNTDDTPTSARSVNPFEQPPTPPQQQQQTEKRQPCELKNISTSGNVEEETYLSESTQWVISITEKLEQARQDENAGSWAKLCIYRVPKCLREGDDKAYVPQIVSLGPYHHGRKRLREMDRHKWRALHHTLKRTNHDVKHYLEPIKELEEKARACYEGEITLSSKEFVEMMVLDGCFMLELFRGAAGGFKHLGYSRNDPVFAMRGIMHSIQRDMIMLENQIPLFVLDRLLGLQMGDLDQKGFVAKLALRFFDPLMPSDEPLQQKYLTRMESSMGHSTVFDPLTEQDGLHCLDIFRRSLLRRGPQPSARMWIRRWSQADRVADKRRQQLIHCVTELKDAGIKFKKRKTDRFWDIKFKNGVLRIPRLLIHDGTKSLFLNLIAFEQCHLDCSNNITTYVIFMDNLINSPQDVGYLHYYGIIEHWLGSDAEVADLFNRLCQEVVFDIKESYLSLLSEQVNRYSEQKWNAWRASLKHNYFSNPWAIISFSAAVVLLLLTTAQTFYGVYGYYKPPRQPI